MCKTLEWFFVLYVSCVGEGRVIRNPGAQNWNNKKKENISLLYVFKRKSSFFSVRKKKTYFSFYVIFPSPNTFLFYVFVCVDVCETKRILLFYLCFLVPTRIPFRRNPQSSSLKKRLTTLSGVCVCYAACQICVIRNLMLLARKEGKRKKKHFFYCMHVCLYVCCIVRLSQFLFYKNRPCESVLPSPLFLFLFWITKLEKAASNNRNAILLFTNLVSCVLTKKPRFPPQKKKEEKYPKNTF